MPQSRFNPDYSDLSSHSTSSPLSCYSASPNHISQSASPADLQAFGNLTMQMPNPYNQILTQPTTTASPVQQYDNYAYNTYTQTMNTFQTPNPDTFVNAQFPNTSTFYANEMFPNGVNIFDPEPYNSNNNTIQAMPMADQATNLCATLRIIEPPVEKFRFRYKSEMHGTHGSLNGANSKRSPKTFPEVELTGFTGNAIIRCSLFQVNLDSPHSHQLVVRKDETDINDPHDVEVGPTIGYIAQFQNMGIIHTAKKNIQDELYKKKKNRYCFKMGLDKLSKRVEYELSQETEKEAKMMNLNQVRLCFEAFKKEPSTGTYTPIAAPIYSGAINNRKSAQTGELRIVRMSIATGKMTGGDEMILLVEKVSKKNIKIRFYELNADGEETWEAYAKFNESDVHHQYAIICQTPPYQNADHEEPVKVYIELVRPSDDERSEKMKEPFTYKPVYNNRKRRRMYSSSTGSSGSLKSDNIPNIIQTPSDVSLPNVGTADSADIDLNNISGTFGQYFQQSLQKDGVSGVSNDLALAKSSLAELKGSSEYQSICERISKLYNQTVEDPKLRESHKTEIVKMLKKYSQTNLDGDSLLHDIINNNDIKSGIMIYKILAKLGLNSLLNELLNARNESVLHCCCLSNAPEFIGISVRRGCDPNIKDKYGNTALHLAVRDRHFACIETLLKATEQLTSSKASDVMAMETDDLCCIKECDLKLKNDDGLTVLHLAIKQENFEICKMLLTCDGSVAKERCCKDGNNALHMAVIAKNPDLVQTILEHSPSLELVNDVNNANLTAIQLANAYNSPSKENDKIIELLAPFRFDGDELSIKKEDESSASSDEDDTYNPDMEFISNNDDEIKQEEEEDDDHGYDDDDDAASQNKPKAMDLSDDLKKNFRKCLDDKKLFQKLTQLLSHSDKWKILVEDSDFTSLIYIFSDVGSLMEHIVAENLLSEFAVIFRKEINQVLNQK